MDISKLIVFSSILLLGCTQGEPGNSTNPTPEASASLSSWRVSLTTSGGVTGGGGGVEIWSDGSVFSREILVGNQPVIPAYLGELPSKQVMGMEQLLTEAKSVTLLDYSNMSTSLVWQAIDFSFRHDWVWEVSDASIPDQLKQVERAINDRKDLQSGTPPHLTLGEVECSRSSAALFIGQGRTFRLSLVGKLNQTDNLDISVAGQAQFGMLSDIEGQDFVSEDKLTAINVSKVSSGWIEGSLEQEGQFGTFRVPAWVTIAP